MRDREVAMRVYSRPFVFVAALVAGCSAAPVDQGCSPACAAGETCVAGACVAGARDMASAAGDLDRPCTPECGGTTPYCAGANRCVACLADEHCPLGTTCANGACVPGCSDDSRCRGDGGAIASCRGMHCIDTHADPA